MTFQLLSFSPPPPFASPYALYVHYAQIWTAPKVCVYVTNCLFVMQI